VPTWPSGTSFIAKLLIAAVNLSDPPKHGRPTPDSRHPGRTHVEALGDFVTRPPFEQQKFHSGALFLFRVHEHSSVPAV
jgi:hypothetical protein